METEDMMESIPCPNCSDFNKHTIHPMVGVYGCYITNPVELPGLPPTRALRIEYHCEACGANALGWKNIRFLKDG